MVCSNGIKLGLGLSFGGSDVQTSDWSLPDTIKGTPSEAAILKANPKPDLTPSKYFSPSAELECRDIVDVGAKIGYRWSSDIPERGSVSAIPAQLFGQWRYPGSQNKASFLTRLSAGVEWFSGTAFRLKDGSMNEISATVFSGRAEAGIELLPGRFPIQALLGLQFTPATTDLGQGYAVPSDWFFTFAISAGVIP